MAKIIYEQVDVTVAAGKEGTKLAFTSTNEQKYKLLSVTCNSVTATLDLLILDERETIADIPLDSKGIIESWIEFNREIAIGHQLAIGFRNGTGGGLTVIFCLKCEIN